MSKSNVTTPDQMPLENKQKQTFGVQKNTKKGNNRKKVATTIVAVVMAAAAVAVPAVIQVNKNKGYTVSINYGQAGGIKSLNIKKGSTVGSISAPKVNGYFFAGYCSDEALTQYLDVNTVITEDTTIYLSYIPIKYSFQNIPENVEISMDGNTLAAGDVVYYGRELDVTRTLKAGHHVVNYQIGGLELINEGEEVEIANGNVQQTSSYKVVGYDADDESEVNLAIDFEQEINTYTLTFVDDLGNPYTDLEYQNITATHGNLVEYFNAEPVKASDESYSYIFSHWVDESGNKFDFDFDVVTKNTTLKAVFTKTEREYTINITRYPQTAPAAITIMRINEDNSTEQVTSVLNYGNLITITSTASDGYHQTQFFFNEGEGVEWTNRYDVNGNKIYKVIGDVNITYYEEVTEYAIGVLPKGVSVVFVEANSNINSNHTSGQELSSLDTIHYGDSIKISYTLDEGFHLATFMVNNQAVENNFILNFEGELSLEFEQAINKYNLTFINEGVVYKSFTDVIHGSNLEVQDPEKESTEELTFNFIGWYNEDGEKLDLTLGITKGGTYTARYTNEQVEYNLVINAKALEEDETDAEVRKHIVVTDVEGNVLDENSKLHYGDEIFIVHTPATGHEYTLNCKGLTKQNASYLVTGDVEITYSESKIKYVVEFLDFNGTELLSQEVKYQDGASLGYTPVRESDSTYTYVFEKWVDENGKDVTLNEITKSIKVYAKYEATFIEYALTITTNGSLTVKNITQGTTNGTTIHFGDELEISYTTKEGYHLSKYQVIGINAENKATGAVSVEYSEEINTYALVFDDHISITLAGEKLQSGAVVNYGSKLSISYKREGHTLTGLKINGKEIESEYTVEAFEHGTDLTISYTEEINKYTVTFVDYDNSTQQLTVNWNTAATIAEPSRPADNVYSYKFLGWVNEKGEDVSLENVTTDLTVYSKYQSTAIEYKVGVIPSGVVVTFNGAGEIDSNLQQGQTLTSESVLHYGDSVTITYTAKEGYHLSNFMVNNLDTLEEYPTSPSTGSIAGTVGGNLVINYSEEINTYIINIVGNDGVLEVVDEDGNVYKNGDSVEHFKTLTINYTAKTGYHITNLTANDVSANLTATDVRENTYASLSIDVDGEVNINYTQTINEYVVNFVNDGSAYGSTQTIEFNNAPTNVANPTKQVGDFNTYTYTFAGFSTNQNATAEQAIKDLSTLHITSDTTLYAIYSSTAIEYTIGEMPSGVSISFVSSANGLNSNHTANKVLSSTDTIHYGDTVKVTYNLTEGYHKTNFKINGAEANNQATLVYNGSLVVEFSQEINTYTLTYGSNIIVTNENEEVVASGTELEHGTILTIAYAASTGKHKTQFDVSNFEISSSNTTDATAGYVIGKVSGEIVVNYTEEINSYTLTFNQTNLKVTVNGVETNSGATVNFDDEIVINYTAPTGKHMVANSLTYTGISDATEQGDSYALTLTGKVSDNITISYAEEINVYAVQFLNEDGTLLLQKNVEHGDSVLYTGKDPRKEDDEIYNYQFNMFVTESGETAVLNRITSDLVVYASYTATAREYTLFVPEGVSVTFVSGNENLTTNHKTGDVLDSSATLHYGDVVEISYTVNDGYQLENFAVTGASINEETNTYSIASNVTIIYQQAIKTYILTIEGEGGTITVTDQDGHIYKNGDSVEHFKTLTINYTATQGYHVTNLTANEVSANLNNDDVRNNTTATLTLEVDEEINISYQQAVNEYVVTFFDEDRTTVLYTAQNVEYDGSVVYMGVDPTKEMDETFTYQFNAFVNENGEIATLNRVTSDLNVYASYNATAREYSIAEIPAGVTITFVTANEALETTHTAYKVLSTADTLHYGDVIKVSYSCEAGISMTKFNVSGLTITSSAGTKAENTYGYKLGNVTNNVGITYNSSYYLNFVARINGYYVSGLARGSRVEVKIPSTYNGKSVYGISNNAFAGYGIQSVNLPSSVDHIGYAAFKGCISLETINLSRVTAIDKEAFYGCYSLNFIQIGDRTTANVHISTNAFYGCSGLTTVTIYSNNVWASISSNTSCGYLIYYASTVNKLINISTSSGYFNEVYGKTWISDTRGQYTVYTKKTSTGGC